MGLQYVYVWGEWEALRTTGDLSYSRECTTEFRNSLKKVATEEDFGKMTAADMLSWVDSVRAAWGGQPEHVFRLRLAPAGKYPVTDTWAHKISWFNDIIDEAAEGIGWSTVDQYGINQGDLWDIEEIRPVIPPHYGDNIHFPGLLSIVTWEVIFGRICGKLI